MAEPLQVEVVGADRLVWEGTATNVIVRTTEGDIGILPRHEPLLAGLVPCAAEIVTADGSRQMIAIDGGFLAVNDNRVSIMTQFASLPQEVTAEQAQRELDQFERLKEAGEMSEDDLHRYHLATAQLKLVEKSSGRH